MIIGIMGRAESEIIDKGKVVEKKEILAPDIFVPL